MSIVFQTTTFGSLSPQFAARSQRRPTLLSRRVAVARKSIVRRASGNPEDGQGHTPGLPRPDPNQTTEQTKDVSEPKVDQAKVENITAGNISNENAEKRANVGAKRPPTLFGKLTGYSINFAKATLKSS